MRVEIDGRQILSEREFHEVVAKALEFPAYYGKNWYALRDLLSRGAGAGVTLVWTNSAISSAISKTSVPDWYVLMEKVLLDAQRHDSELGKVRRFQVEFL
jgi:ribonuclease inhibitor